MNTAAQIAVMNIEDCQITCYSYIEDSIAQDDGEYLYSHDNGATEVYQFRDGSKLQINLNNNTMQCFDNQTGD